MGMRIPAVKDCYATALIISGMVTFIAAYHYLRIFNSWVDSYEYKPNDSGEVEDPVLTGVPFNDAYRYMDWLLTVPLLLIEIVFVMKLPDDQIRNKSIALGMSSATNSETDPVIKQMIQRSQYWTVVSWLTYP